MSLSIIIWRELDRCRYAHKFDSTRIESHSDTMSNSDEPRCGDCYRLLSAFEKDFAEDTAGSPKCEDCLSGVNVTARMNESETADFESKDLLNPFAKGSYHWAALGTYRGGQRDGQKCVCKWFIKEGLVFEDAYYKQDISAMIKAQDFIHEWNKRKFIDKPVRINIPEIWTFDEDCSNEWKRTKVMVEPFLRNFIKFNSNSGYCQETTEWGKAMQALSHFSYHVSDGRYLLIDLQGAIYSNSIVLTDSLLNSAEYEFGPGDFGPEGISTFFSQHKCNKFCKKYWRVPDDRTKYMEPRIGTSMSMGVAGDRKHVSGNKRSKDGSHWCQSTSKLLSNISKTSAIPSSRPTEVLKHLKRDLPQLPRPHPTNVVATESDKDNFAMPPPAPKRSRFDFTFRR